MPGGRRFWGPPLSTVHATVRVFGSIVRGESDASSDVGLLVEMEPGRSLIDLVGLWHDLEDMLGTHVDVLSDGGVSPHLRERICAEAVSL